jgi:long-subunit fatty acid transport protein
MAVHTGTYYAMTDKYQNSITSDFTDNNYDSEVQSDEGEYNYSIKTPARYIASIAFLIKKRGYISIEYEYADYKNAKLNADDYNFDAENKVSKEIYQGASILKAGAEFRVTNNWTARAGYSYYGSPIKSDFEDVDNSRRNISGGFGYKNRKYSLDFAYTRSMTNSSHYLYDPALVNPAEINTNINNFVVTAAFRF